MYKWLSITSSQQCFKVSMDVMLDKFSKRYRQGPEVDNMATKSITRTIVIRDKKNCKALAQALEKSGVTDIPKPISKAVYNEPSVATLRSIFKIEPSK